MKNKTLWKRLAAVALAAVLAVPTALVPAKDADAKMVKKVILQEDFSGAGYDGSIVDRDGSTLTQEDGALRVTGNGNGGVRWILPVEENATYEISYRVKVEKSCTYTFLQTWKSVDGEDVPGSYDKPVYGKTSDTAATPEENENVWPSDGWKQVTVQYTIPNDRNYIQYMVYSNEKTDYDFVVDDVKVSKLSQVPDVIANGTFGSETADTTGWDVEAATQKTETVKTHAYFNDFSDGRTLQINSPGTQAEIVKDGTNDVYKMTNTPIENRAHVINVKVEAGKTYKISYRVKKVTEAEQLTAMLLVQTYHSTNGGWVDAPEAVGYIKSNDWETVETSYTVPEGKDTMQVMIEERNVKNGIYYIDDIEVYTEETKNIATTSYKNVYDSKGFDDTSISFGDWANNNIVEGVGVDGTNAQVTAEGNARFVAYQSNDGKSTYTLEAGKTYRVTLDAYVDQGGSYWIYADNVGKWHNSDQYTNASYETKTLIVKPQTTNAWQQIGVQITGQVGKVFMDNFKIDEVVEVPEYNDGVGNFGKDGYGVQITDAKATATVAAEAGWYDFNVDVKGAEGTSVKVYADDAVVAEVKGTGDWQTVAGTFNAAEGMKAFAVESTGKVVFDNVDVYAHQHNATLVAGKAATCTEDGTKDCYECAACGKKYEDADCTTEAGDLTIPAAHKISYVKKVSATCTKAGHEAYYTCDVCKKVFADAEGTKETKIKSLPKHTPKEVKAVASTYTKTGMEKHYRCSCGKLYADKACTKLTTKAKLTTPVKKLTVAKTSVKSVTAKSKALAVKWTKKSGVTGYEVQVALKKNFKSGLKKATVKGASKTSVTVKKLKAKKTYYVRVRAYKKVEGKTFYSTWSSVKSKKTK